LRVAEKLRVGPLEAAFFVYGSGGRTRVFTAEHALDYLDQPGEEAVFGERGGEVWAGLPNPKLAGGLDGGHCAVGIAVPDREEGMAGRERCDVGEVAGGGADIQDGGADGQDVVDLARMHQSDEGVAHDDDVEVRGG
jgi:hypothetical protein